MVKFAVNTYIVYAALSGASQGNGRTCISH